MRRPAAGSLLPSLTAAARYLCRRHHGWPADWRQLAERRPGLDQARLCLPLECMVVVMAIPGGAAGGFDNYSIAGFALGSW